MHLLLLRKFLIYINFCLLYSKGVMPLLSADVYVLVDCCTNTAAKCETFVIDLYLKHF